MVRDKLPDGFSAAAFLELQEQLGTVLDQLTEREKEMISRRFGLIDGHPRTLEDVAREFGVRPERIRRVESKALGLLPRNVLKQLLGR